MAETTEGRLTPEQRIKLKKAEELIADVQVELLLSDEKLPVEERTDNWRKLYSIRVDLGHECFRLNGSRNL